MCVGLQLGHTDICFINSHLAAHQSKTAQRNRDYSEIVGELTLMPRCSTPTGNRCATVNTWLQYPLIQAGW